MHNFKINKIFNKVDSNISKLDKLEQEIKKFFYDFLLKSQINYYHQRIKEELMNQKLPFYEELESKE